jgi:hypothetical protein
MEIFAVSFLVFIISCAALAMGLWFGRGPIHGGCRPDDSGGCAQKGNCSMNLRCANRRAQTASREV